MSQTPPQRAPKPVDFTDRKPFPQSKDKRIKFVFGYPIAESDRLEIQFREEIGELPVGKVTSDDDGFIIEPDSRTVWLLITEENTRKWYRDFKVTEENRVRTLTGTLLHRNENGDDYPWSGLLEVSFRFEIAWTRG